MDSPSDMPRRRGRGARTNPATRFDPVTYEPDPAEHTDAERRQVATQFLPDHARTILAKNSSPDLPFRYSLNPYRGCEHGCIYCLHGDTLILMADGRTRPLCDLQVGDAIYGTVHDGWYRRYVKTEVLAHWRTHKPAYRISLADGTSLIASGDHRFLTERGWKHVTGTQRPHLTPASLLMGVGNQTLVPATPAFDVPSHADLCGQIVATHDDLRIVAIESLGTSLDLYDITTGTGDFIANGVISHNCYARPTHEYLGFSAGLDFETKILVKHEAPQLLAAAFDMPSWTPQVVMLSGNTDPYQPVERRLELTRGCLAVFARYRNPVSLITKNALVLRDLDLLVELAERDLVTVVLSITSLDPAVTAAMEPRTARPTKRLQIIERLAEAGIPVGVNVAPIVPGLTDEELPAILEAAAAHGARFAGYGMLRLPEPVGPLFEDWLREAYPDRAERVLRRLRSTRRGQLSDDRFGHRMRGSGPWAELMRGLFRTTCARLGLNRAELSLATHHFRRPHPQGQMDLFGG